MAALVPTRASVEKTNHSFLKEKLINCIKNLDNRIGFSASILNERIEDQDLSVDSVECLLTVAGHSNPLKAICEELLRGILSSTNCWKLLSIAGKFGLSDLHSVILTQIESGCFKETGKYLDTGRTIEHTFNDNYDIYHVLYTIKKSSIQVVVLNSDQETKCYRTLKKKVKITELQLCSVHHDKEDSPLVVLLFGEKMHIYDPVKNQKLKKMNCSRSKCSLVGLDHTCYAIGGVYNGQGIRTIDCYDLKREKWKAVAYLPDNVQTTGLACEVIGHNIYIFTFQTSSIKRDLVLYVFNTKTGGVDTYTNLPVCYHQTRQIKSCVLLHYIYIATDDGLFLRINTIAGSVVSLPNQIRRCRNFGMYSTGSSIFVVGGSDVAGNATSVISSFNTITMSWHQHHKRLPDEMHIYGNCKIMIPRSSNATVVPFYINNYHEIATVIS